jgi:hypothetical protein
MDLFSTLIHSHSHSDDTKSRSSLQSHNKDDVEEDGRAVADVQWNF